MDELQLNEIAQAVQDSLCTLTHTLLSHGWQLSAMATYLENLLHMSFDTTRLLALLPHSNELFSLPHRTVFHVVLQDPALQVDPDSESDSLFGDKSGFDNIHAPPSGFTLITNGGDAEIPCDRYDNGDDDDDDDHPVFGEAISHEERFSAVVTCESVADEDDVPVDEEAILREKRYGAGGDDSDSDEDETLFVSEADFNGGVDGACDDSDEDEDNVPVDEEAVSRKRRSGAVVTSESVADEDDVPVDEEAILREKRYGAGGDDSDSDEDETLIVSEADLNGGDDSACDNSDDDDLIEEETLVDSGISDVEDAMNEGGVASGRIPQSRKRVAQTADRVGGGKRLHISPCILLPFPAVTSLPSHISDVLARLQTKTLSSEQSGFFDENRFLPVTALQWDSFGELVDQLHPLLEDQGAVLVQPPSSQLQAASCGESPPIDAVDISIRAEHSGKVEWKTVQTRPIEVTCATVRECTDGILSLPEFEATCTKLDSVHARDLQLEAGHPLLRQLAVRSSLANLAGNELRALREQPGINTPFYDLGSRGSSFPLHSEDENTYSVNMCYSGIKTRVVIAETERSKLEKLSKFIWTQKYGNPPPTCDQFIHHLKIYIPTTILEEHDIQYTVIHQHPGQLVITSPGSYSQGFNATNCFAEAINYARNWDALTYARCSSGCSVYYANDKDWEPLNLLAQSLNEGQPYVINRFETISRKAIARNQAQMGEKSVRGQKMGGVSAMSLAYFATAIAGESVLDLLASHSVELAESSPAGLSDSAESHYHQLQRAHTYAFLGEVMTRIAAVGLYRIVTNACQENRNLRSHDKGVRGASKKKGQVLYSIATKIHKALEPSQQASSDPDSIVVRIKATMKLGRVFHELAKHFGEGILMLFPDTKLINTRNIENAVTLLARPGVLEIFWHHFQVLRPQYQPRYIEDYQVLCTKLLKPEL